MQNELLDELLFALAENSEVTTKRDFQKLSNAIYARHGIAGAVPGFVLLERYREHVAAGKLAEEGRIVRILRKRAVRSLSGVAVISLLTKFWGCPGKCVYCPTFDTLPKSYVPKEPAVMRAELNGFDPVRQVQNRLRSLESTGHLIGKCDVRIIGGTWSVYPKDYQESVIRGIYDGHTTFGDMKEFLESRENRSDRFADFKLRKSYEMQASESLEEAKKRNETAASRVIGIAIETRPDWIDAEEIERFLNYGVTRVEIGYQTTDDAINELNRRGHGNLESMQATQLLKDAGFKVVAHMMPNLLGSTPNADRESMREVFANPGFRPDELKIYPMVVTDKSELTEIWKNGGFRAYDDEMLVDLMADLEAMIPEYVRLNRSYRDIPASEILEGSKLSNLREHTSAKMVQKGLFRRDISAREIRAKDNRPENAVIDVQEYDASGGKDYFLQFIDPEDRTVFSVLRLRIPSQVFTGEKHFVVELQDAAIIREVHTFGDQLAIGAPGDGSGQHMGFGKRLIERAEEIVRTQYPQIKKIAVISGVGARGYYRKRGYELGKYYMVKDV